MTALSSDITMLDPAAASSTRPLAGRHAIVTGGSGGIGGGIARALFSAGASVTVVARRPPGQWSRPMPSDWSHSDWIDGDLDDPSASARTVERYLENAPPPDILVHSAVSYGTGGRKPFEETGLDEWQQMFNVNVHAPFVLTRALLPQLRTHPRSLVLYVSSEVVFNAGPHRVAYAATKSALLGTMSGLAKEAEGTGLSVVGVLPEMMVDTPGIRRRRPEGFDYSAYATPDTFARPIVPLAVRFGTGHNGESLVVTATGDLIPTDGVAVASQSRSLASEGTAPGSGA